MRWGGAWEHSWDTDTTFTPGASCRKDTGTGSHADLAGSLPSKARFEESMLLRLKAVNGDLWDFLSVSWRGGACKRSSLLASWEAAGILLKSLDCHSSFPGTGSARNV